MRRFKTHRFVRHSLPHLTTLLRQLGDRDPWKLFLDLWSVLVQPQKVRRLRPLWLVRVNLFLFLAANHNKHTI